MEAQNEMGFIPLSEEELDWVRGGLIVVVPDGGGTVYINEDGHGLAEYVA